MEIEGGVYTVFFLKPKNDVLNPKNGVLNRKHGLLTACSPFPNHLFSIAGNQQCPALSRSTACETSTVQNASFSVSAIAVAAYQCHPFRQDWAF